MSRNGFDVAGDYFKVQDHEGAAILFTPREYVEVVATSFGEKDAILTDLVVLNSDGSFEEHDDVMIFQGALIATLKRRLKVTKSIDRDPASGVVSHFETITSRRVLGVVAKGEAKKGQSAPYILDEATPEQRALAQSYHDANPAPEPVKKLVKQTLAVGNAPAPTMGDAAATVQSAVASNGVNTTVSEAVNTVHAVVATQIDPFAGPDGGDPFSAGL